MPEATTGDALFDSYVVVDWSAASVPRRGRDSIWIGHLRRDRHRLDEIALENPPTRREARDRLLALFATDRAAGRRTLAGFDFPLGYSSGFARRLSLSGPAWLAIWNEITGLIEDAADNANNRFAAAAALNRRASGAAAPFWGCPPRQSGTFLAATHHRQHEALGLSERRLAEERLRRAQPVWKLYGNGSAGSQGLTGIPVLHWLREQLAPALSVWPFETGLAVPRSPPGTIIVAEAYPSLIPLESLKGDVKDAAQVRTLAGYFATLDASGCLAPLFCGDPSLTRLDRGRIEAEEGWVLGVTGRGAALAQPTPLC